MENENQPPKDPIGSDLARDDSSFADIVAEFVEGLSDRLKKMEAAIQAGDFETLRAAAHQLKGTGGGYGYPLLTEQAAQLEQCVKAKALADCTKSLDDLKQLCRRVVVSTDT